MPYNLKIKGWMGEEELKVIESWAQSLSKNSHIIEIGSFYGRSTYCWAASIPDNSILYCYDQWCGEVELNAADIPLEIRLKRGYPIPGDKNTYENFKENTKIFNNIIAKQVYDSSMINWAGPDVDVVFIDIAHANPVDWDYIQYWLPKIKKGGFICGHDYKIGFPDVDLNVQKLESILDQQVQTFPGTLWKFLI